MDAPRGSCTLIGEGRVESSSDQKGAHRQTEAAGGTSVFTLFLSFIHSFDKVPAGNKVEGVSKGHQGKCSQRRGGFL